MTNEIELQDRTSVFFNGVTYYVKPWEDAFIEALGLVGSIRQACKAVGIGRATYYEHHQYSLPFQKRVKEAKDDAYDTIYEEAHRRAVIGVDKPVFFQGEEIGTIKEYSDTLMAILLKGTKPEMFTNRVDITTDGQAINKPQVFLPQIDDGNTIEGEVIDD